jgi:molecular chaperone DnaK (HSP70)
VLKADPGVNRFTIFASDGRADLGGDRYTDLIADHLRVRLAETMQRSGREMSLSIAEETRLWQVAEQAKRDLSTRSVVRIQLPETNGVEGDTVAIEREWFERASRQLVLRTIAAVNDAYRIARLVLDRGRDPGDQPGTPYLSTDPIRLISALNLQDDGIEHIDHVVLVGGASQMPMIRREFQRIFGSRLEDPARYGLDPLAAVAMGLAQHEALESLDFGYPNWAITAELTSAHGRTPVDLYSPYSPIFKLRTGGSTTVYSMRAPIPDGASSCRLVFRRVAPGEGVAWKEVRLPAGSAELRLELSLLGDIELSAVAHGQEHSLYPDRPATPWKNGQATHPAWIPPRPRGADHIPWSDPVNDGPG